MDYVIEKVMGVMAVVGIIVFVCLLLFLPASFMAHEKAPGTLALADGTYNATYTYVSPIGDHATLAINGVKWQVREKDVAFGAENVLSGFAGDSIKVKIFNKKIVDYETACGTCKDPRS